jgi:hydroxymethylbilane synthase
MLTIGSRGSKLALWQANWVAAQLMGLGHRTRIRIIRTTGDKITDVALSKVGTKGLFTKEIEEALLDGSIDLAVHSLKDMPTDLPDGLTLSAIPKREDPRDAIAGKALEDLPKGAKVGTSSLRRAAQLRLLRPDLVIEPIRGNVDTRLRKLDEGQYAAIVLASAGLRRLGFAERIAEVLSTEMMVPAVGQGALAIETRQETSDATEACCKLNDQPTEQAVRAERALLAALGGGCQVPIGAHATIEGEELRLDGIVIPPVAGAPIRRQSSGAVANAAEIGRELGEELLAAGAGEILEEVYGA